MPELNFTRYTPKEKLQPSSWAERNVLVPAGNARPGRISFREAPFQKGMLDVCADPNINRVTMMTAAQIGKTMVALIMLGYFTDHQPRSQILMQPTQTDMKKWLETKFDPMVSANGRLQSLYAKPRGREGANNSNMKTFRGGHLILAWAGSLNTTRGVSAPITICDEVDAYEHSEEGHPVDLLWQRSATFGDQRKLIEMSTPTVHEKSRIENSYYQGDQRRFWVVCPHCEDKHTLEWTQVKFDKDNVSSALIHCPKCDHGFNDTERIAMIRYAEEDGGGWEAERDCRGHASFQLSALYSPLRRLQDIVQTYIAAEANRSESTFWNTCLGETYEHKGDTADEHELAERVEDYGVEVPDGVKVLVAGTDVQKDRLECEVVGWGTGEERWNIAYEIFYGDTSNPRDKCYKDWIQYLSKGFVCANDGRMFVSGVGIDSGFNTVPVYEVIYQHGRRPPPIFALKGVGGWNRETLRSTGAQMTVTGRMRPAVHTLAVDTLKGVLMKRLNLTIDKETGDIPPGYCHFPTERAGTEYFTELTSEVLLHNPRTNKWKWTKKDHDENEALDCAIYAYGTLLILKPDLQSGVRHGYFKSGKPSGKRRTVRSIKNQFV